VADSYKSLVYANRLAVATYAVFDLAIIFSAAKYSAILLPFLAVALYFIQKYYLRTSRQMRHLDIEAKTPLYSLFGDISSGLEHIRAYGWQSKLYDESLRALDYSQKPFYYMFTIQRWLELAMDCTTLVLAVTLVATTTFYKETTTQAALGLSMLNLVTFSTLLNMVIGAWITMETALGAIARLRSFISTTPVEECRSIVSLPQNWPNAGNVEFVNVTAKYK
jgi:ABC-type transport system involved in cytochrome bd biosynthesis fused ATPase/permease subunit